MDNVNLTSEDILKFLSNPENQPCSMVVLDSIASLIGPCATLPEPQERSIEARIGPLERITF
jgi:hypothetical protein